jgi:hypothetical protein
MTIIIICILLDLTHESEIYARLLEQYQHIIQKLLEYVMSTSFKHVDIYI